MLDPLSQMKREYHSILDDADSANRVNFVPSQSLHDALWETFLKVTNNEMYTAQTMFTRALTSNNFQ